ncbi:MAG: sulfite exporter TauE/SafE family protein [Chloroflexi bacterium]|nr:sulfite exporter TauE/SafE family protein [Chloroflexota bacterium]
MALTLPHIITLLATGIGVGFTSGLLGVGGCFIMTPIQYMIFTNIGIPSDVAIKLAFGTNLLVVLPTAISGTWRHNKKGAVWWKAAIVMGSCGLMGAFGGATLATYLPGQWLKIAFGVVVLAVGIRMLTARPPKIEHEPKDNPWLWVAWAVPVGIITGIIGIGGGVLMVPVMVLALKFKMHNAVATSLATMIFTSIGGVIGYIINGLSVPELKDLAYTIGYVNLTSWFLLAATSVGMAQLGAVMSHKLPAKQLRYIFIVIIFYVGLKMLGVFNWLGWPI